MKKFVIICHEPFTERLSRIWNISELLSKGVDVEYWDVSKCCFPGIDVPDMLSSDVAYEIKSYGRFAELMDHTDVPNTVFVAEFSYNWNTREFVRLLADRNCNCVRIDLFGNTRIKSSFLPRIIAKIGSMSFDYLYNKIRWNLYKARYIKKKTVKTYLSSSSRARPDIKINHPDYELFMDTKPYEGIRTPFILFIDIYYPLHPDMRSDSGYDGITPEPYRELMKSFFEYVEKKFGMPVVIAAHPKSKYRGGEFGERRIIYGETSSLTKSAELIISHHSNSLSFIALADKPFVLVYPDSFRKMSSVIEYMHRLANFCRKKAYNIDRDNWDDIDFSPMDSDLRSEYINNFLASEATRDRRNADIIIESLLKSDI